MRQRRLRRLRRWMVCGRTGGSQVANRFAALVHRRIDCIGLSEHWRISYNDRNGGMDREPPALCRVTGVVLVIFLFFSFFVCFCVCIKRFCLFCNCTHPHCSIYPYPPPPYTSATQQYSMSLMNILPCMHYFFCLPFPLLRLLFSFTSFCLLAFCRFVQAYRLEKYDLFIIRVLDRM